MVDAAPADAPSDSPGEPDAACDVDTDGDGIPDVIEDDWDSDLDGEPNDRDLDSDGDGVSDAEEHAGAGCTRGPDSDGDGGPDRLDTDSDGDRILDGDEATHGLDRTLEDSDGDGCNDLAEVHLDGCVDPRDAFLVIACDVMPGLAVFTVAAPHEEVTVRIVAKEGEIDPASLGIAIQAAAVSPRGAAVPSGDLFLDVQAGASITFLFTSVVDGSSSVEPQLYDLVVEAGATTIDTGRLLVSFGEGCPVLI